MARRRNDGKEKQANATNTEEQNEARKRKYRKRLNKRFQRPCQIPRSNNIHT